jgi:glycolate oxidase
LPEPDLTAQLTAIVGTQNVRVDEASRLAYGTDGVKGAGRSADVVVIPADTIEVSQVVRACARARVPFVPRGAGTGYSGGAVPLHGGVVISLERMNRIVEVDEMNLVAVVEPGVITGQLQETVERVGLFYPPDPASLAISSIGGNVAECAGGPRAFKYGTTKQYVLGLEAVLPTGEIVNTGGKAVKNVVGYDLTHLLVGSEGTLAIITKIILRLVPRPAAQATVRATFPGIEAAAAAVVEIVRRRIVPSALELIDGECLEAVARYLEVRSLAPPGTAAMLLIEVDGGRETVTAEADGVADACRAAGASELLRADDDEERDEIWRVRRDLTYALKLIAPVKFNHDIVVP